VPRFVTIFVTTARSGTQWVAQTIKESYPDSAVVTHEPIGYEYRPRQFIRAYDQTEELRAIPAVGNHLRDIAAIGENKIYVEVGFPSAATIPLFHQLYGDRLKVVQLVRHPILASASMITHGWYSKTRAELREGVLLLPTDAGAFQKHYSQRWASLSRYEKCLFYWTEIHMYGIEMHSHYHNVPFLRVRFEDLIASPERHLRDLVEFVGLPFLPELKQQTSQSTDRYRFQTGHKIEWQTINDHPLTVALAQYFGYDVGTDDTTFGARYYRRRRTLKQITSQLVDRFRSRLKARSSGG